MKSKKWLEIVCVVCLLLMFTACSNQGVGSASQTPRAEGNTTTEAATETDIQTSVSTVSNNDLNGMLDEISKDFDSTIDYEVAAYS